jgi:hypothetical protein
MSRAAHRYRPDTARWGGPRSAGDKRDSERIEQHVIDDGR